MILDSIFSPKDLAELSFGQLEVLCQELRSEIIRITLKNGGHLGSNLGAVELIVACHYVFDCPADKFIFDVGHQAYTHKLLTGRRALMENLRQKGGASGFPLPSESEYDSFIAGHASTSLSASLGIAAARDLSGDDFSIVSFVGDGALSGGMIYEAFNNISELKNFIVILNDNQMSISESVGMMRKYLSKLLSSKKILAFRKYLGRFLDFIPRRLAIFLEKLIKNLVGSIRGGIIFEEFGFQYVGPIDGHNIVELIKKLRDLKDIGCYKPVLVHAVTKKGKGYSPAEADATNLHGLDSHNKPLFCDIFSEEICNLALENEKIICITPAMKSGSGLTKFSRNFPDRFFDVGICEEHAVTFAAGLAATGYKPFVCLYSTFLQRSFDQIYHDVFLPNLNVTFIIDKAGLPGPDGKTHAGLYDSALLSLFRDFPIMSPSDAHEMVKMLKFANGYTNGPIAVRFPKGEAFGRDEDSSAIELGHGRIIHDGYGDLIVSFGAILHNVIKAIDLVRETKRNYYPTVIDARFVRPFDFRLLNKKSCDRIFLVDEAVGGAVAISVLLELAGSDMAQLLNKVSIVVVRDGCVESCSKESQFEDAGLSARQIASRLMS